MKATFNSYIISIFTNDSMFTSELLKIITKIDRALETKVNSIFMQQETLAIINRSCDFKFYEQKAQHYT